MKSLLGTSAIEEICARWCSPELTEGAIEMGRAYNCDLAFQIVRKVLGIETSCRLKFQIENSSTPFLQGA